MQVKGLKSAQYMMLFPPKILNSCTNH